MKKLALLLPLLALAAVPARAEDPATNAASANAEDLSETFALLLAQAEKGNADAQYAIGCHYFYGSKEFGVAKNLAKAAVWLRKSAEQGNAHAQNALGGLLQDGCGVEKNPVEALEWFHKSAEQGNAAGQLSLGRTYFYGEGVPVDLDAALEWSLKAADQGLPQAMFAVGKVYENPEGESHDWEAALKWYRKAAESDEERTRSFARNSIGTFYERGHGVERDADEAERLYRKAAEVKGGNPVADRNLGYLLASGKGRFWNDRGAVRQLKKAARNDETKVASCFLLFGEFGLPVDPRSASAWKRWAEDSEKNEESAGARDWDGWEWHAFGLGALRENGVLLDKDPEKAVVWYRKAAERGLPRAQLRLAEIHWTGKGVEKDEKTALDWIRKAVAEGSDKAKELLALQEGGDIAAFEKALLSLRPARPPTP